MDLNDLFRALCLINFDGANETITLLWGLMLGLPILLFLGGKIMFSSIFVAFAAFIRFVVASEKNNEDRRLDLREALVGVENAAAFANDEYFLRLYRSVSSCWSWTVEAWGTCVQKIAAFGEGCLVVFVHTMYMALYVISLPFMFCDWLWRSAKEKWNTLLAKVSEWEEARAAAKAEQEAIELEESFEIESVPLMVGPDYHWVQRVCSWFAERAQWAFQPYLDKLEWERPIALSHSAIERMVDEARQDAIDTACEYTDSLVYEEEESFPFDHMSSIEEIEAKLMNVTHDTIDRIVELSGATGVRSRKTRKASRIEDLHKWYQEDPEKNVEALNLAFVSLAEELHERGAARG